MKKVVLKLELHDEKSKQKAMKTVSGLSGVDSIVMDMKDKKLTVTGDIDPVTVVEKLRKMCHTEIVSVGPAKEPEKKKEDGPKKDDQGKKDDSKDKKKDEPKKDDKAKAPAHVHYPPPQYQYYQQPYYYYHQQQQPTQVPSLYYPQRVVEDENPNACVIC